MGGQPPKIPSLAEKSHPATQEKHIIQRSSHQDRTGGETTVQGGESAAVSGEKRTVIIGKRKTVAITQDDQDPSSAREKNGAAYPDESVSLPEGDGMSVEIRDTVFRARDEVFEGRGIRKPSLPQARDSTLLHTELRPKKKGSDRENTDDDDIHAHQETNSPSIKKWTRTE
jgi:hypothetical protein